MLEEVTTDGLLALHDAVVNVLLDTLRCDVAALRKLRVEQDLRTAETLFAEDDLATIWKLICFLTCL